MGKDKDMGKKKISMLYKTVSKKFKKYSMKPNRLCLNSDELPIEILSIFKDL